MRVTREDLQERYLHLATEEDEDGDALGRLYEEILSKLEEGTSFDSLAQWAVQVAESLASSTEVHIACYGLYRELRGLTW